MGLVVARKCVVPCPRGSKGVDAHILEGKFLLEVDRRQGSQCSPQRVPCRYSSRSFRATQAATQTPDRSVLRQAGGPRSSSDPGHCLR